MVFKEKRDKIYQRIVLIVMTMVLICEPLLLALAPIPAGARQIGNERSVRTEQKGKTPSAQENAPYAASRNQGLESLNLTVDFFGDWPKEGDFDQIKISAKQGDKEIQAPVEEKKEENGKISRFAVFKNLKPDNTVLSLSYRLKENGKTYTVHKNLDLSSAQYEEQKTSIHTGWITDGKKTVFVTPNDDLYRSVDPQTDASTYLHWTSKIEGDDAIITFETSDDQGRALTGDKKKSFTLDVFERDPGKDAVKKKESLKSETIENKEKEKQEAVVYKIPLKDLISKMIGIDFNRQAEEKNRQAVDGQAGQNDLTLYIETCPTVEEKTPVTEEQKTPSLLDSLMTRFRAMAPMGMSMEQPRALQATDPQWTVGKTAKSNNEKITIADVSVAESAGNLVWTIKTNQTVYNSNNTYNKLTINAPAATEIIEVTGFNPPNSNGLYVTPSAVQKSGLTFTITTKGIKSPQTLKITLNTCTKSGSDPAGIYQTNATLDATATKVQDKGTLSIKIVKEAGAENVNLTNTKIQLTKDGVTESIDFAQADHTKDVGSYTLAVQNVPAGYIIEPMNANATINKGQTSTVTFTVKPEVQKGNIALKVVNNTGANLTGAQFTLVKNGVEQAVNLSDQTLSDQLAGDYTFKVTGLPVGYSAQINPSSLTLGNGETKTVTVTITAAGTLNLTVQKEGNVPDSILSAVKVTASKDSSKTELTKNGNTTLPVGSYTISVENLPADYTAEIKTSPVNVTAGQTSKVTVTIKEKNPTVANYVLQVQFPSNEGYPKGMVAVLSDQNQNYEGQWNGQAFQFSNIKSGQYTLSFKGMPLDWKIQSPNPAQITVTTENKTADAVLVKEELKPGQIRITGRMQDNAKQQIKQAARFELIGPNGQKVTDLVADQNGEIKVTIDKPSVGQYKVKLVTPPTGYKASQSDNVTNTITINSTDQFYDFTAGLIPSGFNFIVHVTNSSGDPLQGAEFQVVDANTGKVLQVNGVDLKITSDGTGTAKAALDNVPVGNWKLVNTKAPRGYKPYPEIPFTLKNNDTKAEFNISLMRSDASRVQWDVYLKDKAGNPVPNKELYFYEADGVTPVKRLGQPLVITTSDSGEYKGGAFVDIYPGTYVVKFKGDNNYTAAQEKVTIPDNVGKVTTNLITDIKGEQGTITVKVVTIDGSPVPNAGYQIFIPKKGEGTKEIMVAQGLTDKNGIGTSPLLPLGNYQVKLVETGNISVVEVNGKKEDNPQDVLLTTDKKQQEVTFHVKTELVSITTAGSLKIDGAWVNKDADDPNSTGMVSWTVTATKNASVVNHGIQQVKFSVPTDEMGLPNLPKVTKIVKNGDKTTMEEVSPTGVWKKVGDNWVYEESRLSEKSTLETTYQYTFEAPAIDGAPKYSLTGSMKIVSDNPMEIIPPATGTKVLDQKVDLAYESFVGQGTADNSSDTIAWTIQDPTLWQKKGDEKPPILGLPENKRYNENKVPGKFIYTISLPENSGSKPFNGEEALTAQFFEEYDSNDPANENKKPLDLKYTAKFDEVKKVWIVEVERPTTGKFRPQFNLISKIDREQTVDQYRIQLKSRFESGSLSQNFDKHIFTAYTIPQLPGERSEVISTCSPEKRHSITLYGEMTEDKKNIRWTARVTNLSNAGYEDLSSINSFVLNLGVGEGLGDAKIISVNSVGKTFPYIWDSQKVVFDNQNAGKTFDLRADYTHHYIPRGEFVYQPSKPGDTYSYITGTDKGWSGLLPYTMSQKTDLNGANYLWDRGSSLYPKNSGPNYQRMAIGEYMTVTFETPIIDFDRGSKEGYTVTAHSKRYDYGDKDRTDSSTPNCQADNSLTLKNKANNFESTEVYLHRNGIGEVRGNGKYINDGKDIEWSIDIKPLLKNVADISGTRNLKVKYQLVSVDEKTGSTETGLGDMANIKETAVKAGGMTINQTVDATKDGGTIDLQGMKVNESYKLTFTTPVNVDKSKYRLKIIGFYDGDKPLQEDGAPKDSNIGYVEVPGKTIKISALKRWEKLYENQQKPEITLNLTRVGINGSREVVLNKKVQTPNDKREILIEMDKDNQGQSLPRFDKNGFLYEYYVTENPVKGYQSQVDRLSVNGEYWLIRNIADDTVLNEKDPFKYVTKADGTYPEPFVQDGPDIRNADATGKSPITGQKFNTWEKPDAPGVNYKAEYSDSIVGKWGEQTSVPGQFNMNLTIEGKGKYGTGDVDVVFVLDNSNSMRFTWKARDINRYYKNSKMKSLSETVQSLINELEQREGNTRVGIVNFATVVPPLTNDKTDPPDSQRPYYDYPERYEIGLSDTKTQKAQIQSAVPGEYAARYNKHIDWSENDGQTNVGTKYDGMTNIADGIRRGAELLYPENEKGTPSETNRKKMMIIISDGAPVAHLKLKYFPMDTSKSFKENLQFAGGKDTRTEYGPYVLNNNKFRLYGAAKYTTENGVQITDQLMPTVAVSNYFKELHPKMEIFSVAIDSDTNGFASSGRTGDDFDSTTATQWQEQVLRGVASDPQKHYYKAENDAELKEYLKEFQKNLPQASIVNGVVEDPMGDMIILDAKNGWKVASDGNLEDGDFFLSDNQGNYLAKDGTIQNALQKGVTIEATQFQRQVSTSTIAQKTDKKISYTLDTNGQPLEIYDFVSGQMIRNAFDNGIYRYVLAINNRSSEPNVGASYIQGATGFTVITNLDQALKAIKDNKNIIVLNNADKKDLQLTRVGLNQMPKEKATPGVKNLLKDVKVERVGDKIKITGLNLSTHEEVRLRYRIHLKTEDPSFAGDYYYPANKTTTLDPRPGTDPGKYRYFPIPSVKGPVLPISLSKVWLYKDKDPKTGNVDLKILDPKDVSADLLALGKDSVDFEIHRYKAKKVNDKGEFVDEKGTPIGEGGALVKDPNTYQFMGIRTLGWQNDWKEAIKDLPAYDNTGRPFIYEITEKTSLPGYTPRIYRYVPNVSYTLGLDGNGEGYRVLDNGYIYLDNPLTPASPEKDADSIQYYIKRKGQLEKTAGQMEYVTYPTNRIKTMMPTGDDIEYVKIIINRPDDCCAKLEILYLKPQKDNTAIITANNIREDRPQGEFELVKVDQKDKKTFLKGAIFSLVKLNEKGKELPETQMHRVSDEYGKIRFTQLEKGTYKLKEVQAPTGYQLKFEPIDVTVGEPLKTVTVDGKDYKRYTVTFKRGDKVINPDGYLGPDGKPVVDAEGKPVLTGDQILIPSYTVTNEKMNLPKTGGLGFDAHTAMIGLVLLILCAYVYKVNREEEVA